MTHHLRTQSTWDCQWNRLGYRLTQVAEADQPEGLWVCVRHPDVRRSVADEDCADCEFWEPAGTREDRFARANNLLRWRLQCE